MTEKLISFNGEVRKFHLKFKQVVNDVPTELDPKTAELRLNLLLEELIELAEGYGSEALNRFQRKLFDASEKVHYMTEKQRETLKPNLVKVLDAYTDLQFVLSGAIIASGMDKVFIPAFEEVQDSNMSKACKDKDEAFETAAHFRDQGFESVLEEQPDGSYLCFRKEDKKLLKSIGYRPASLDKFINGSI